MIKTEQILDNKKGRSENESEQKHTVHGINSIVSCA